MVADKAHITVRHYQMFESGERRVSNASFTTASKVLKTLEIDLGDFVCGECALTGQESGRSDDE